MIRADFEQVFIYITVHNKNSCLLHRVRTLLWAKPELELKKNASFKADDGSTRALGHMHNIFPPGTLIKKA